eukprot:1347078-Prymnesium_polylepis.2
MAQHVHNGTKMIIPTTLGLAPGTYDPARTHWEATVGTVNEKGQQIMIDGTLVETQRPAWMSAARRGMIELMVEYIDEKRDLGHGVDFREPTGYTPLAIAVQHNQLKLAQLLIEKGADVNTMNNWRDTPLHRACEQGFVEMTQLLMDNGADPLLQDNVRRPGKPNPRAEPSLPIPTPNKRGQHVPTRSQAPSPSRNPNPNPKPETPGLKPEPETRSATRAPLPRATPSAAKPEGV